MNSAASGAARARSLPDTLHLIVSGLALPAQKKGLELIYRVPAEVPDQVVGDPGRLRQVLTNLLGNSIKFTDQGEVVVSAEVDSRVDHKIKLHFTVKDTGIGIPPDKLETVFEPFAQVDSSTTRVYGGTGLGLEVLAALEKEPFDGILMLKPKKKDGAGPK